MGVTVTDWSIDAILKILEITSILGGGSVVVYKLGRTTQRVEQTLETQNTLLAQQAEEIRGLKDETKKHNDVLVQIALQKRELELLNQRYEELRHGEGFVFPISKIRAREA